MSTRTPKRPRPVRLGDLIAYAKAPPTKRDPRWYWQIVTPSPGAQVHVDAGRWTDDQLLDELARRRQAGDYRPSWQAGSMGELLVRWLHAQIDRPKLAKDTKRAYLYAVTALSTVSGDVAVSRLDLAALQTVQRDLEGSYAPRTVRLYLSVLRLAWRWARARGHTPDRDLPPLRLTPARDKVYNDRTPTHADVRAVIAATPKGWPRLAVEMLYGTGARCGEICALMWSDVDTDAATLTLGRGQKTGAREVHIGPTLVQLLLKARTTAPEGHVLDIRAAHRTRAVAGQILRACQRADVPRFTAHGLRRRAVQDLFAQGTDPATAAAHLGHTVGTMVRSYARAQEGEGRRRAGLVLGHGGADNVVPFRRRQES